MRLNTIFSIFFVACVAGACSHSGDDSGNVTHSVYLCRPAGDDGASELSFSGVVKENENISLGFKAAGEIKKIYVKEGDRVRNGQLLASLDGSDYALGVEAIQIQYDQLKQEMERARRLMENKSMSQNDYDKAMAGLRQLGVQLQVNKNKLAYTRLYSPVSGVVESVNYAAGEMVDAGTPVLAVMTSGGMEVACDIPVSVYMERDRFREIRCSSSVLGDETVPMNLLGIVPKADSNQLYRMNLSFSGESGKKLTAGMNVEVLISLSTSGTSGLTIPSSALFSKGDKEYVWVMKPDSTVRAKEVITDGKIHGDMVRVTDGLSISDNIVRAGVSALTEGEKVRVIKKASKTNVGGLL